MLEDTYFSMQLTIQGTIIFNNTIISSDKKTHDYKLKSSYGKSIYYTSYATVGFVENRCDDDRIGN